ncbi:hypothetical protein KUTeg_004798 [Tegillarca granosa]|uniref:Uncharacterized protein n=1 Tax=Tegillarca granosa TaxID=220873 RepID=A0ABQ9FHY3_TEGGR|nr:hypothetical protein KUTeg_004798 [Tegillarca granosa]
MQGPVFKDLKIRTNGSTEDISRALAGRNIGFLIAAVCGGVLIDKLTNYLDLFIAVFLDLIAVTTMIIPWSPNPATLGVLICLQGLFEGITVFAGQKIVLNTWKEKSASPMHIVHFGYGMGSFLAPNIANPFLAIEDREKTSHTSILNLTSTERFSHNKTVSHNATFDLVSDFLSASANGSSLDHIGFVKETRVEWAYIIITGVIVLDSLIFYWYQIKNSSCRKMEKIPATKDSLSVVKKSKLGNYRSWIKLIDPATCTGGNRCFGVQVFVLLFIYYFNAYGGEAIYGKFIRNFSIDRFEFSNDESALLNTSFWISFSLGRFCGFIAAILIPIRILIILEAFAILVLVVLLNIFAYDSSLMLWVLTQFMGFLIGPMYPAGIAWGNSCLEITGTGMTVLVLGASCGGIAYLWIIGHLYDNNLRSFLYLLGAYGIAMVIQISVMTIVARTHPVYRETGHQNSNTAPLNESENERIRNDNTESKIKVKHGRDA